MTRLLNFLRPADGSPAHLVAADEIVRKAEELGRVEIKRDYRDQTYAAEILFTNRNGSTIRAAGNDTEFFTALCRAIQEAERLK